jgi:hypothetical protein
MKKRLASTEKHRSILWKPRMLGEEKPCFHTGESSFGNTYQNPVPRYCRQFGESRIDQGRRGCHKSHPFSKG